MSDARDPALDRLIDRVKEAGQTGVCLNICGGGSKSFYGENAIGESLDVSALSGISCYEATELVVTVRAGTKLEELERVLAAHGQCLAFEPPHFAGRENTHDGNVKSSATIGGMVAAGLAGPSRVSVGSVRDFVLGATLLNGRGQVLTFGGQVMKNVAGYDVSRLLAGSLGILGVICEVSLKVLPIAAATSTVCFESSELEALDRLNRWAAASLPLNASAWCDGRLFVRLAGANAAVRAAVVQLGGELLEPSQASHFWSSVRDHRHEFFTAARDSSMQNDALWRVSVPSTAASLQLPGRQFIEWGGALRWWRTTASVAQVRDVVARAGGHATLFYASDKSTGVFTPLTSPLDRIHREIKKAFDPARIFNRGRLYADL